MDQHKTQCIQHDDGLHWLWARTGAWSHITTDLTQDDHGDTAPRYLVWNGIRTGH